MQLTNNIIRLNKKYQTPFLIVDLKQVRKNYRRIKQSIDGVEVFYAIKANDHPKILEVLIKEGASFEVSSENEMNVLLALGVPGSKIICLNSIKTPEFLEAMIKNGVEIMAYDSKDEVDKIAKYAPSAKLVLRINVPNEGSDWPLTKKFGVDVSEAIPMLLYAKKKKVQPVGITFHVGSQCLNKNNWATGLYECNVIWEQAKKHDIELNFLSLGGGIPVQHIKKIPSIEEIGDTINRILKSNFKTKNGGLRVSIEPGRGLIGDTAIMTSKIVGKAKRGGEDWLYIDVGVFNGLMETIEDFEYELKTLKEGRKSRFTIGGPSCDSVDIPFKSVDLPSNLKSGDYLYILNSGAYTTVYAAAFNGFDVPKVYFVNE